MIVSQIIILFHCAQITLARGLSTQIIAQQHSAMALAIRSCELISSRRSPVGEQHKDRGLEMSSDFD